MSRYTALLTSRLEGYWRLTTTFLRSFLWVLYATAMNVIRAITPAKTLPARRTRTRTFRSRAEPARGPTRT